jgi:hypothetical protein
MCNLRRCRVEDLESTMKRARVLTFSRVSCTRRRRLTGNDEYQRDEHEDERNNETNERAEAQHESGTF